MDYLKSNIKSIYFKYLAASVGSAMAVTIYSLVDTIAVGKYEGPIGTAALAVINPVFGIQVFIGIIFGIGGAVLMSNAKGKGDIKEGNGYFTVAVIISVLFTAVTWFLFFLFSKQIFMFFGADEAIYPTVIKYGKWLIRFWPVFIFSIFLGAFVRNDNSPALATSAVIIGGLFNVFGDWFFVFPLNMGIEGAAIATVTGTTIQCLIMLTHFLKKNCGLKFVAVENIIKKIGRIMVVGISSGILDFGTVVTAIIINNQILRYGFDTDLSVYGVVSTIAMLIQAIYSGIGQAIQPLVSVNYGAGETKRVSKFLKMAVMTAAVMGIVFTAVSELLPVTIVKLFMKATPDVLAAAPKIMRIYSTLYVFLGVNITVTYYLQSVMREKTSLALAAAKSIMLSSVLLYVMPLALGINGVWLALPVCEAVIFAVCLFLISSKAKFNKKETV